MTKKIAIFATTALCSVLLVSCNNANTPPADDQTLTQPENTGIGTDITVTPVTEATGAGEKVMGAAQNAYTLAEVAQHATAQDCWMAVEGKVYDVSKFIADQKHPGGPAIIFGCGKDATSMFNARGKEKEPHSQTARDMLPSFYIGDLKTE